ncbi:hypothetical protein M2222_001648 [Bradyrhizobium elkanii]|uniref:hypothetical protein n=1 Tax=Bradyrhizobium elkanii TaxID=29448 RepID=UPI002169C489|nr:hypothetical protein [Bradyrhizobium elkanii]MCS3449531.1 hypothetical protein [Bradyrhizobium elkanii]MCS3559326.1 hypothetical protein [Bradyrhizobium elkanii]MCW2150828.1 hypothetical protein [Bradyrhizobium elkanii]MCW2374559.1 hypothetical protein [Bradyrhizobium elkanii]
MSDTGYPRQVRELKIVDEDHQKEIRNLFLACNGRLKSFHLHGRQWRFDRDELQTGPIPPPGGWGTTFVTLHEVLGEEGKAHVVDEDAILRGQWSGDLIFSPTVTQSPPPGSMIEATGSAKSVGDASAVAIIVNAVRDNRVAIQLAAFSLLAALDAKVESLRDARSNDVAQYEDLKRLVEEFLAAAAIANEAPVVEKTLSLAKGLKDWWTKDSASICNKALNMSLFVGGLSICALAGAYGVSTAAIVTVGALIGGKNVADSLTALAKALPSKDK